jgi:hypothetical protein
MSTPQGISTTMAANPEKARDLFLHVAGKLPPEHRDDYLAEACKPVRASENVIRCAKSHLITFRGGGGLLGRRNRLLLQPLRRTMLDT